MEDDEKAWTEVVATGGQTFLLFGPGEGLSGQDLLQFGFSPLQLRFLVELGQDFLLAFPFITCIYLVTTGMRCLELTAALQQQCCGFSVLLYQTTINCLSPEGEPHPLVLLPTSSPHAGTFPAGNQPRPPDSRSREPHACRSAIPGLSVQGSRRDFLPRDFRGTGIILALLWREEYSLRGGVVSDWDSEVVN